MIEKRDLLKIQKYLINLQTTFEYEIDKILKENKNKEWMVVSQRFAATDLQYYIDLLEKEIINSS